MVMTLLLDVAAFILIFIEAQSYVGTTEPRGYQAAHPAIGIVITALIIVNVRTLLLTSLAVTLHELSISIIHLSSSNNNLQVCYV